MLKKIHESLKHSIHEYFRLRNKRSGKYIWVGEGKDPFS